MMCVRSAPQSQYEPLPEARGPLNGVARWAQQVSMQAQHVTQQAQQVTQQPRSQASESGCRQHVPPMPEVASLLCASPLLLFAARAPVSARFTGVQTRRCSDQIRDAAITPERRREGRRRRRR
eukprot:766828-Pleurochrysis_carterae.AAC.1